MFRQFKVLVCLLGFATYAQSALGDERISFRFGFNQAIAKRDVPFFCEYTRTKQLRIVDVLLEDKGDVLEGGFEAKAIRGSIDPELADSRLVTSFIKDKVTGVFNITFEFFRIFEDEETSIFVTSLDIDDLNDMPYFIQRSLEDRRWCSSTAVLNFGWEPPR
jgi:hypothetical protein